MSPDDGRMWSKQVMNDKNKNNTFLVWLGDGYLTACTFL
jgi:hypothetical protein